MTSRFSFLLLGTLIVAPSGYANNDAGVNANDDSDLPAWASARVEPLRERIGLWVDDTSRSIDSFFGTPDSLNVDNESYLRIGQEVDL